MSIFTKTFDLVKRFDLVLKESHDKKITINGITVWALFQLFWINWFVIVLDLSDGTIQTGTYHLSIPWFVVANFVFLDGFVFGALWMGGRYRRTTADKHKQSKSLGMENSSLDLGGSERPITSQTFFGLQRAIGVFPSRYPDYATRPPKMIDDVRPWLKSSGFAGNDREAHVFGVILSEHFKFSPDTQ